MTINVRLRRLILPGFTLLFLFAGETAAAQSRDAATKDLKYGDLELAPSKWAQPAMNIRGDSDPWAPPDIDEAEPQVARDGTCSADDIVSKAGARVEELVHNLDRYSATEVIQHQTVNHSGKLSRPEIQDFNYIFSLRQAPDGYMIVDEYRDGNKNLEQAIDHVSTGGTPSLVLVFHPNYVNDYLMSCEGLGEWQGQPAWQIRFEQRDDSTHMMSEIIVDGRAYGIRLRGRGWVLADSYQMAHIEMDAAKSIPKIRLRLHHIAIDYVPVSVPGNGTKIWLPSNAELYSDFRGHRFYRRHTYMNFKFFSVEVDQQFGDLK